MASIFNATRRLALTLALALLATAAAAQDVKREITNIAGDLYRFQNNFHYSVFLVTGDGIIATDPINAAAATWLKQELAARFGQPVRYLIYSHDHADHISGGEVFADTAVVVAHENAKRAIVGEDRPTAVPGVTFRDSMTIELGGKTVELAHVGKNHSDNSIVVTFPAERALFAVDFIPVRSLAFRDFPDAYIPEWVDSLKAVERIDFDILLPGHGPVGTKADVAAFRGYMEQLRAEVLAHQRAGRTLEETQALVTMTDYRDWGQYERFLPLNVAGMYQRLALNRRGN
ncbi:MAG: MBL fold metallo-hydrolase [Inquilinus sp.]|nr:MBL fold metallo-hydrolase [Inquilinus sp.]